MGLGAAANDHTGENATGLGNKLNAGYDMLHAADACRTS